MKPAVFSKLKQVLYETQLFARIFLTDLLLTFDITRYYISYFNHGGQCLLIKYLVS